MKDGRKVSIPVYTFKSEFKDCHVPVKIVVLLGKWQEGDEEEKEYHILFSTDTSLHFDRIISTYLMRWGIEHLFRQLKDILEGKGLLHGRKAPAKKREGSLAPSLLAIPCFIYRNGISHWHLAAK